MKTNNLYGIALATLLLAGSAFGQKTEYYNLPASSVNGARAVVAITIPAPTVLPSDLCTGSNRNCYTPGYLPPITGGSIGNRIGLFQGAGYVRSTACFYGSAQTNDNETIVSVLPVAGPYGDGTYIWQSNASYRPDRMQMNCYFNGSAGYFVASSFNNGDNVTYNAPVWVATPPTMHQQTNYSVLNALTGNWAYGSYNSATVGYDACVINPNTPSCQVAYCTANPYASGCYVDNGGQYGNN